MNRNPATPVLALLGASVMAFGITRSSADEAADMAHQHQMATPQATAAAGETVEFAHQHHHQMAPQTTATTVQYTVPDLKLVRADGETVSLPQEMDDGRPVVLNFIYTSCTTICPLLSQILSQFQDALGTEISQVHLLSISIDPEADTPARLTEYARKFGAGPEWQFYTGTIEASLAAQQAFGVYRGDKMSHQPVTLLRAAPGQPWRRFDGFVTPDALVHEYHQALAAR